MKLGMRMYPTPCVHPCSSALPLCQLGQMHHQVRCPEGNPQVARPGDHLAEGVGVEGQRGTSLAAGAGVGVLLAQAATNVEVLGQGRARMGEQGKRGGRGEEHRAEGKAGAEGGLDPQGGGAACPSPGAVHAGREARAGFLVLLLLLLLLMQDRAQGAGCLAGGQAGSSQGVPPYQEVGRWGRGDRERHWVQGDRLGMWARSQLELIHGHRKRQGAGVHASPSLCPRGRSSFPCPAFLHLYSSYA